MCSHAVTGRDFRKGVFGVATLWLLFRWKVRQHRLTVVISETKTAGQQYDPQTVNTGETDRFRLLIPSTQVRILPGAPRGSIEGLA